MEKKRYRTGGNLGSFENDTDEVWANGDKKNDWQGDQCRCFTSSTKET